MIECQACGQAWVCPGLNMEELDRYYPPGYISFPTAIEDEKSAVQRIARQFGVEKRARRVIQRTAKPGKVLDIGCATGIFLNAMKQQGWECYGIEPSTYAAQYAASRFGIEVFNGFLAECPYEDEFFDAVTLWDVLEHLPDPREELARVWQLLKPGGLLVVSMPNSSSWERRTFGKYWAGWDIPRHFYIYNDKTISRMLSEHDFTVQGISSFTGRHGVMALCVQFWMNDHSLPGWLKKAISSTINSVFARMVTYPYYMLADRINRSSIMVVFAKKSA